MPGVIDKEDAKKEFVSSYTQGRTTSLKLMSPEEYKRMCVSMKESVGVTMKKKVTMDTWRKRTLASLFGYFKLIEKPVNAEFVKGVACRAARVNDFNSISENQLKTIYNEFLRQQKIVKNIGLEQTLLQSDLSILKTCGIEITVSKFQGES